jgi:hypothetical protein
MEAEILYRGAASGKDRSKQRGRFGRLMAFGIKKHDRQSGNAQSKKCIINIADHLNCRLHSIIYLCRI